MALASVWCTTLATQEFGWAGMLFAAVVVGASGPQSADAPLAGHGRDSAALAPYPLAAGAQHVGGAGVARAAGRHADAAGEAPDFHRDIFIARVSPDQVRGDGGVPRAELRRLGHGRIVPRAPRPTAAATRAAPTHDRSRAGASPDTATCRSG